MLSDLNRRQEDVVPRASCGFPAALGVAFQQEHVRTEQDAVPPDGIPAEAERGKPVHVGRPVVPVLAPFRVVLLHAVVVPGDKRVLGEELLLRDVA